MRALLVTHGELGAALLSSARYIYAVDAPVDVISNRDLDLRGLTEKIRAWIADESGPAVIMVDVGGGSCGIAARAASADREDLRILAGVNLPMVLTYLSSHSQLDLVELSSKMLDRALHAVASLEPVS